MQCPRCNGPMWDNREGKKNPKAPDYKCKEENGDCKWRMTKAGWEPSDYPTGAWMPKDSKPKQGTLAPSVTTGTTAPKPITRDDYQRGARVGMAMNQAVTILCKDRDMFNDIASNGGKNNGMSLRDQLTHVAQVIADASDNVI